MREFDSHRKQKTSGGAVNHFKQVPRLSFNSMRVDSNCSLASLRTWASCASIPSPFKLLQG